MLNFYALERWLAEQMEAGHVPGLALAVVRDLEVVYCHGWGVTSVDDGRRPITPQTLFRLGSITKSMTTTAIMRLVEEGKLDLDRPANDYVPWLAFSQAGVAGEITLRRLLSHSAGLPTDHVPFGRRGPEGLEAYVRHEVAAYPFLASPGRLYAYSNPGIRVAGYVAEVVSGRPYTELMEDLVFDPLQMERTTFDPAVAMTYPLAQSHDLAADGTLSVQHRYADDSGGYPSGGIISTALDLTHFAIMQMDGGRFRGRRILAAESVAEMQRPQVDRYALGDGAYGLGLSLDTYQGLKRVSHNGSISTFGSRLVMLPSAGAAVVLLVNRAPGFWAKIEAIVDRVVDQLLDLPGEQARPPAAGEASSPGEAARALWPDYEGAYLGDWRGLAVVRTLDDQLVLDWNGERLVLHPRRDDLYWGRKPGSDGVVSIGFVTPAGGPVEYVQINSSPCRRFDPDTSWLPDPGGWAAYEGRYAGVENLTVRFEGGQLLVYSEDEGREMPAVPLSDTRFACDVGLLEFQVAADGAVPSLRFGNVYTLDHLPGDD
ncbi:MAG: serine hydrolase [Anaerolineae bacterium]